MNVADTNNGQRSRELCHTRGHKQNKCDKISDYGNGVLPLGNTKIRHSRYLLLNNSSFGT